MRVPGSACVSRPPVHTRSIGNALCCNAVHDVIQPNGQLCVSLSALLALAASDFRCIRMPLLALRRAVSRSVH